MSSLSLSRCLLLLCLAGSASVMAQSRLTSGFVGDLTLDRYGMVRNWYSQVPTLRLREKILSIKQSEDLLFAASDKGQIHCLEAETGRLLWSQDVSEIPGEVFPPALTGKYVYVCGASQFSQLDRKTGQVIQTLPLPSAATSGPAASDDFCYVQTVNNFLYAIALKDNPEDEGKKWPYKRKFTLPYIAWFFNVGSPLFNPPILTPERVVFAGQNGVVFASDPRSRNIYYRFITNSQVAAPISFRERTLYVATQDYNLYAVNISSGELKWRFASGFPIIRQPVPLADDVIISAEGAGLMCVSNQDGTLRWNNRSAHEVVGVSQTRVYGMSDTKRFLILDRVDGTTIGTWFSPDFPVVAYNQTTDRLFLATERGLIQCLSERGNVRPYYHELVNPPGDEPLENPADPLPSEPEPNPPGDEPAPPADEKMEADPADTEEPAEEAPEASEEDSSEEMPEESEDADSSTDTDSK